METSELSFLPVNITSPSQLEEITLGNDTTLASFSVRSPGAACPTNSTIAATRTHSVKEFEDQLATLKKENFNLKLRIYFLEERMGPNFNVDKETIVKNNVELHVEVVSLKNELKEKIDLLDQASKALDLQDEEHQRNERKKDELLTFYRQQIDDLKQRQSTTDSCQAKDLDEQHQQENYELEARAGEISALRDELARQTEKLFDTEDQLQQMASKLEKTIKRNEYQLKTVEDSAQNCIGAVNQLNGELNRRVMALETHRTELETRNEELEMRLKCALEELQTQSERIDGAAPKTDNATTTTTIDLEKPTTPTTNISIEETVGQLRQLVGDSDICDRLQTVIAQKQQQIVQLKADKLKACKIIQAMIKANGGEGGRRSKCPEPKMGCGDRNSDMDLLVNYKELVKQLEEKNSVLTVTLNEKDVQICHLQSRLTDVVTQTNTDSLLVRKDEEIAQLTDDLARKHTQMDVLSQRIDELMRCEPLRTMEEEVEPTENWREKFTQSEKMRCDVTDICTILSGRLEELATFLDSLLLKHKSCLGLLGTGDVINTERIRQIVDQSLDLSRSFTMSVLLNTSDERHQSLVELSNLSSLLNRTNTSLLSTTSTDAVIIQTLRQQVVELTQQLRLRDVEMQKLQQTMEQKQHSDTETWSEPDRNVSRARIGLNSLVVGTPDDVILSKTSSSSDEEEGQGGTVVRTQKLPDATAKNASDVRIADLERVIDELLRSKADLEAKIVRKDVEVDDLKMALENARETERKSATDLELLQANYSALQLDYNTNYVRKSETADEADDLRKQLLDGATREEQLRTRLIDSEDRYNLTRNELAQATLQFSEAVLEKTQMASEKVRLEHELLKRDTELVRMRNAREELRQEKLTLERRTGELEVANAELRNRIVRLQSIRQNEYFKQHLSTSMPCTLLEFGTNSTKNDDGRRHHHQSCHNVDDIDIDDDVSRQRQPNVNGGECSSPDLGIESDQGRFSSLETQINGPRPFLPPLQLSESMNNVLVDINFICDNERCRQKSEQICEENGSLRGKLYRTRRALEETAKQLKMANQRKKQVEKTICKEIQKTSQVLRKAKANLDSGPSSGTC